SKRIVNPASTKKVIHICCRNGSSTAKAAPMSAKKLSSAEKAISIPYLINDVPRDMSVSEPSPKRIGFAANPPFAAWAWEGRQAPQRSDAGLTLRTIGIQCDIMYG